MGIHHFILSIIKLPKKKKTVFNKLDNLVRYILNKKKKKTL